MTTAPLRDNLLVVTQNGADLSERCIKCGSLEITRSSRIDVSYYSWWSLVTFVNGALVSTQLSVRVGLCKHHASRWRDELRVNVPLILVGIGSFVGAWVWVSLAALGIGVGCLATGMIRSHVRSDPVRLSRYKEPAIWLRGAGEGYLAHLQNYDA